MFNRGFEDYNSRLGLFAMNRLFPDVKDVMLFVIYFGTNDSLENNKDLYVKGTEFE